MTRAVSVSMAALALGVSDRRVRQLARLHPQIVASERPLRVDVAALREIRGASPAALASAALHVCEALVPKLAPANRTPEVLLLLLIDQLHPELRAARFYPEPLRRLRERAGLPPEPEK
jgi:hypothetical protein